MTCVRCGRPKQCDSSCQLNTRYEQVVRSIQEGTVTVSDFNCLLETLNKSSRERLFRRTRPPKTVIKGIEPMGRIVPKHQGINNPPAQGRGRRFAKGSPAKKKQNEAQALKWQKLQRACDIIGDSTVKYLISSTKVLTEDISGNVSEVRQVASRLLRDPAFRLVFERRYAEPGLNGDHRLDDDWLYNVVRRADTQGVH